MSINKTPGREGFDFAVTKWKRVHNGATSKALQSFGTDPRTNINRVQYLVISDGSMIIRKERSVMRNFRMRSFKIASIGIFPASSAVRCMK